MVRDLVAMSKYNFNRALKRPVLPASTNVAKANTAGDASTSWQKDTICNLIKHIFSALNLFIITYVHIKYLIILIIGVKYFLYDQERSEGNSFRGTVRNHVIYQKFSKLKKKMLDSNYRDISVFMESRKTPPCF